MLVTTKISFRRIHQIYSVILTHGRGIGTRRSTAGKDTRCRRRRSGLSNFRRVLHVDPHQEQQDVGELETPEQLNRLHLPC